MTTLPRTTPTLEGARVTLREHRDDDAALIRAVVDDPHIPSITTVPSVDDASAIAAYLERQRDRARTGAGCQFIVVDEHDEPVGQIGVMLRDADHGRASVGYWIARAHRRRGLARAALETLVPWAIGLDGIHRLELCIEPWNVGSRRVAEGAGFRAEGLLRGWQLVGGEPRDMLMYAMLVDRVGGHLS